MVWISKDHLRGPLRMRRVEIWPRYNTDLSKPILEWSACMRTERQKSDIPSSPLLAYHPRSRRASPVVNVSWDFVLFRGLYAAKRCSEYVDSMILKMPPMELREREREKLGWL